MKIRFDCPECEYPGRIEVDGSAAQWRCPRCQYLLPVAEMGPEQGGLPCCRLCGNHELYRKKDFPHSLGMAILLLACLASTITYWLYDKWLTWAILIGSAAFDGLLYLWVKDVVVCYRCDAHYRGLPPDAPHAPFELTVYERYRQERMRREQVR